MTKLKFIFLGPALFCCSFLLISSAYALSPETEVLLKLLQNKGLISREDAASLRNEVENLQTKSAATAGPTPDDREHYHSVRGIAERLDRLEKEAEKGAALGKWAERIHLGGLLETEVAWERSDYHDPAREDDTTSDLALATAELDVDVAVSKHVSSHFAFLWEEEDTEPVDLDEGIITIDGFTGAPLFVNVGKMYVPFGRFESHFISYPLTLQLGETRESAVVAGIRGNGVEFMLGAFNGDINKTGADELIESYVAAAVFTLPDEAAPGLSLSAGISYISNIADSDGLQDVAVGTVSDYIGGFSAFLSAALNDKFFLDAEYLGATESFAAGELPSFDGGLPVKPRAWNLELAYAPLNDLELAVSYAGCDDCGAGIDDFLPEKQYGGVVIYNLNEDVSLAVEYLYGEFENNDKVNSATGQLAVEF